MTLRVRASALSWVLAAQLLAFGAHAQSERALTLEEVLASVATHHPLIAGELQNVRAAEAEALAARGEFDTKLKVQGRVAPAGYYDPRRLDVVIEQPTPLLGASLYAGYRIGRGNIAPYYGEQRTLDHGEVRGGIRAPLLQNRAIDSRRAGVRRAELQRDASEHGFHQALLEMEQSAAEAYYSWLAAGRSLAVTEDLVSIAEQRDAQISDQVALGSMPRIESLDNRRVVLQRRAKVVQARRYFEKASIKLSLFVRDAQGQPLLPGLQNLPLDADAPPPPPPPLEQAVQRALAQRPELAQQNAQLAALRVERDLARNQLNPTLDAFGEVSKDFGTGPSELVYTLGPTVAEVGVTFSMPLWLRKARGKLRAAQAKLAASEFKLSFARDKVRSDVLDAWSQLRASEERVEVARETVDATVAVASGEQERFKLGASTVLVVNLREQAVADARITLIDAQAELAMALARAKLVTGERLLP